MRVFALNVEAQQQLLVEARQAIDTLRPYVSRVLILVWRNPLQKGSDCGTTARVLSDNFGHDHLVQVRESGGDLFVGVFNEQLEWMKHSFDYMLCISPTSHNLITPNLMAQVTLFMEQWVRAIGVVQSENPLTRDGVISNTCAFWHLKSLSAVGGFDNIDARPEDFSYDTHHQGVGELAVLFALDRHFTGKPLVVLEHQSPIFDTRTQEGSERQQKKLANKERRVDLVLGILGKTRSDLKGLVYAHELI